MVFKVVIYGVTFIGQISQIKAKIEEFPTYGDVIESLDEVRKEGSWYVYNPYAQHWDKVQEDKIPIFSN
jgi:hypothetical protein